MLPKVLFVDDEIQVLLAVQRSFRKTFEIDVARCAQDALRSVSERGPYAVVVSDMRMPVTDGVRLLTQVRALAPDTVRIMLTGAGDSRTAVDAVNQGQVYRFLQKPVDNAALSTALGEAVERYQCNRAERDVLERTLSGCVKVLTEVVSVVNPAACSRALRMRQYVRHMTVALGLTEAWQFDLAAMLSQLGSVTMPEGTDSADEAAEPTREGVARLALQASLAHDLLVNIPRLERVAEMIAGQFDHCPAGLPVSPCQWPTVKLGAQLLRVAGEFDRLVCRGDSRDAAMAVLRGRRAELAPAIVESLAWCEPLSVPTTSRRIGIGHLETGMVLDEDLFNGSGLRLASKGLKISEALLTRLQLCHRNGAIGPDVRVLVPGGAGS
jgi:response regulator RpfG family c-di-GMP phosphodiesterase